MLVFNKTMSTPNRLKNLKPKAVKGLCLFKSLFNNLKCDAFLIDVAQPAISSKQH